VTSSVAECHLFFCLVVVVVVVVVVSETEHWDSDDVCQWLDGLGMGEYCPTFQERYFTGQDLLRLKKTDLAVSLEMDQLKV